MSGVTVERVHDGGGAWTKIRLSKGGDQAQVAPSLSEPGNVLVGFYTAEGEPARAPSMRPEEADALIAAIDEALGRPPTGPHPLEAVARKHYRKRFGTCGCSICAWVKANPEKTRCSG